MDRSGSVLDQFRTAEQRVAERLRELEPLVAEYHELQQVAQRLGLDRGEQAPASDKQRPASSARTRGRRRRSTTNARSARSTREPGDTSATAVGSAARTPAGGRRRSPSAGDERRPPSNGGSRQQDVLRLVNQHPGITVREIARELGVDATGLYRPVHRLEQQGAISKRGAALQPTGR